MSDSKLVFSVLLDDSSSKSLLQDFRQMKADINRISAELEIQNFPFEFSSTQIVKYLNMFTSYYIHSQTLYHKFINFGCQLEQQKLIDSLKF